MTPHQALDNLLQARKVKLTDEYFKEIQEYGITQDEAIKLFVLVAGLAKAGCQ